MSEKCWKQIKKENQLECTYNEKTSDINSIDIVKHEFAEVNIKSEPEMNDNLITCSPNIEIPVKEEVNLKNASSNYCFDIKLETCSHQNDGNIPFHTVYIPSLKFKNDTNETEDISSSSNKNISDNKTNKYSENNSPSISTIKTESHKSPPSSLKQKQKEPNLHLSDIKSCNTPSETSHSENQLFNKPLPLTNKKQKIERPFACNICNKKFTFPHQVIVHKRTHTGERPFSCNKCNKRFADSSNLSTHIRAHSGERPFSCDLCKKSFMFAHHLVMHKRTHTGERPYSCKICNKKFSDSSNRAAHIRTHTGERPYTCDICNKKFAALTTLIGHKRTHTGEKPFACNVCNKKYAILSTLVTHKRIHTGERPYACNICNKKFSASSNLSAHKKIHTTE